MIRLVALYELLSQLDIDDINALVGGNQDYIQAVKHLPWVQVAACTDETIQLQLQYMNVKEWGLVHPHSYSPMQLSRIRHSDRYPNAIIVDGHQTMTEQELVDTCKDMYKTCIYPYQVGPLPEDAPDWFKLQITLIVVQLGFWETLIRRYPSETQGILAMKHLSPLNKAGVALQYNKDDFPTLNTKLFMQCYGSMGYAYKADNQVKVHCTNEVPAHWHETLENYTLTFQLCYDFIRKIQQYGYVTPLMMEVGYNELTI